MAVKKKSLTVIVKTMATTKESTSHALRHRDIVLWGLGASVALGYTRTITATVRPIAPGDELSPNAGHRPSLGKRHIWKKGSADEQTNAENNRD
jgi:hypothetical protein